MSRPEADSQAPVNPVSASAGRMDTSIRAAAG
jgi:hypothetical protein